MSRPIETKYGIQAEALYLSGLSTRAVAKQLGLSGSWVSNIVKRLGIGRNKRGLYHKPDSTNKRTCRFRARDMWERKVGPIPEGFHVHHIDGDYTNNDVSNLEVLSPKAHTHLHHPENLVPKWLRPEVQAYKKVYMKEYRKRASRNQA